MYSSSDIHRALTSGRLGIDPTPWDAIQPASVDLHLHATILVCTRSTPVDPYDAGTYPEWVPAQTASDGSMVLRPQELILASTVERVSLPNDLVAVVEGKSSLARLGLLIHQTAGFVDPGFIGQITLEMAVAGSWPVILRPGMPICQISFSRTDSPAASGYDGKYQNQDGPRPSRYHHNKAVQTS